jgi:hypothetical protein
MKVRVWFGVIQFSVSLCHCSVKQKTILNGIHRAGMLMTSRPGRLLSGNQFAF